VRRAWQQALDAGRYSIASDLTQYLYPATGLASAGSGPQREDLHLEGSVDLAAQLLQMKLWQTGGSVLGDSSGVEMRVDKGVAYTRRLAGAPGSVMAATGNWQEAPDISGSFAPGGDALAFLSGIKNVQAASAAEVPPGAGAGQDAASPAYRRYSFEVDGLALARYMRDRLEEQLRDRGKLPVGVTLDTPTVYRDAQGNGEVWIDDSGLPLRLMMHVVFPDEQDGSHVEADFRTDFSGFPVLVGAPSLFQKPIAWVGGAVSPERHPGEWAAAERMLIALIFGAASLALLVLGRRLR
jgi:hypothetical protein